MPIIQITKKIRYPEDPNLGTRIPTEDILTACQKKLQPKSLKHKHITIKSPDNLTRLITIDETRLNCENVSFAISKQDAVNILNQCIKIVIDPFQVVALLKELDADLGAIMLKNNIQFTENDYPQFLIAGQGNYVPGPPPYDYRPRHKQRLLNILLIANEKKGGINQEGMAPKFVGYVDGNDADIFIASGHLFTEEKQVSRLLLHGSLSHRLMFNALLNAVKNRKLSLKCADGKMLTPDQLLELLVYSRFYPNYFSYFCRGEGYSLFSIIMDLTVDVKDSLKPDDDNFSCRSPMVFNSLLLCFGKELGLPNLQHYLLDSHWKAAYEMVYRMKSSGAFAKTPDSRLYTYCMEALSTTGTAPGDIGTKLPFTLEASAARLNSKYQRFSLESPAGVVKKINLSAPAGEYRSWNQFFKRKHAPKTGEVVNMKAKRRRVSR